MGTLELVPTIVGPNSGMTLLKAGEGA